MHRGNRFCHSHHVPRAWQDGGGEKVLELIGIDVGEIAAFGDSDNDVGMFEGCGYSVAVANASQAAKKSADYVCERAHADGVIEGLGFLGLL